MTKSEKLRAVYHANVACGDVSETAMARMRAQIEAAEAEEKRAFVRAAQARVVQDEDGYDEPVASFGDYMQALQSGVMLSG